MKNRLNGCYEIRQSLEDTTKEYLKGNRKAILNSVKIYKIVLFLNLMFFDIFKSRGCQNI